MITGVVSAKLDATIQVRLRGRAGKSMRLEAGIDTGFNGSLTLPQALIIQLALKWKEKGSAILGDGSLRTVDLYVGTIDWDRKRRIIAVLQADGVPLIGTALLAGYEFRSEFRPQGKVTIKKLRPRKRP